MRISGVTDAYYSLRPHVYYAGTHLVNYDPAYYQKRDAAQSTLENVETNSSAQKSKSNFPSTLQETKEDTLLEKHLEKERKEFLLQRLDFITGVHYSQAIHIQ